MLISEAGSQIDNKKVEESLLKVLVLGCHGFIGTNLVAHLLAEDFQVWGSDLQSSSTLGIEYLPLDLSHLEQSAQAWSKQGCELIVNCTGSSKVQDSFTRPIHDLELNTLHVYKFLECARQLSPLPRFINISSAAVYGNPKSLPVSESQKLGFISPYGFHKALAESVLSGFQQLYGLPTLSLRAFSVYGPGLKNLAVWDICRKILETKNGRIELFGTGEETRDYIYIEDLCRLITTLAQKKDWPWGVINAASGTETKIKDLAETLVQYMGQDVKIEFKGNTKPGDPLNWRADVSTLQALKFSTRIDMNEGLRRYVNWLLKGN